MFGPALPSSEEDVSLSDSSCFNSNAGILRSNSEYALKYSSDGIIGFLPGTWARVAPIPYLHYSLPVPIGAVPKKYTPHALVRIIEKRGKPYKRIDYSSHHYCSHPNPKFFYFGGAALLF